LLSLVKVKVVVLLSVMIDGNRMQLFRWSVDHLLCTVSLRLMIDLCCLNKYLPCTVQQGGRWMMD
jgi:hypothetical protein